MQSERPRRLNERTVDYGLAVMEFCETLPHTGAKIERLPSDPFQGKGDRWVIDFNAEAQSGRVAQNSGDENLNVANVKMLPIANANSQLGDGEWEKGNGHNIGTCNTSTMATLETSLRSSAALRLCVKNFLEVRIELSTVCEDGAAACNPPYNRDHGDGCGYAFEYAIELAAIGMAPPKSGETRPNTWNIHFSDSVGEACSGQMVENVAENIPESYGNKDPITFYMYPSIWGRAMFE